MAVQRLLQSLLVEVMADEAHGSPQNKHAVQAAVRDQLIRLRNDETQQMEENKSTQNNTTYVLVIRQVHGIGFSSS